MFSTTYFEKGKEIYLFEFAENAEKKIWIDLLNNKYFYGNFNLNFSLQNKQLQQIH